MGGGICEMLCAVCFAVVGGGGGGGTAVAGAGSVRGSSSGGAAARAVANAVAVSLIVAFVGLAEGVLVIWGWKAEELGGGLPCC